MAKKTEKFGDTGAGIGLSLIFSLVGILATIIVAGAIMVKCVSYGHDKAIETLQAHTNDPYRR